MGHLWRATRICRKPVLSGRADEFGRTTDKQRQVSYWLKEKKIMHLMIRIRLIQSWVGQINTCDVGISCDLQTDENLF